MATKPTAAALAKMGLEYNEETGLIQKIGIKVHPAVQAAEDSVTNKPKHIDEVEGYVDEPYPENINQEPIVVLNFDGPVDGDEWAIRNEKSVAALIGAVEAKLKPVDQTSDANFGGMFGKFKVIDAKAFDGLENKIDQSSIDPAKTTGFDVEVTTDYNSEAFESALKFGKQINESATKTPVKKPVRQKGSKSTTLKKPKDVDEDFFEEILPPPEPIPNFDGLGNQRCFIGIDNGISGSIGIFFEDGTYHFTKTPTRNELNYTKVKSKITRIKTVELKKILSLGGPGTMVMIERPMVNPQRFKATVSALRAYEATITILETLNLPYEVCDSKEWQKAFLPKGCMGDDLKPASLDVGNRLFPLFKNHTHADRDGLLIAAFCKQKHK